MYTAQIVNVMLSATTALMKAQLLCFDLITSETAPTKTSPCLLNAEYCYSVATFACSTVQHIFSEGRDLPSLAYYYILPYVLGTICQTVQHHLSS